jgi:hypothetical protein
MIGKNFKINKYILKVSDEVAAMMTTGVKQPINQVSNQLANYLTKKSHGAEPSLFICIYYFQFSVQFSISGQSPDYLLVFILFYFQLLDRAQLTYLYLFSSIFNSIINF